MGVRERSLGLTVLLVLTSLAWSIEASADSHDQGDRPTASFVYSPANPSVGETVTFTSTSQASEGEITQADWDLDGDGEFDDAQGTTVTWTFATPGAHSVALRVRQSDRRRDVAFADVQVSPAPPAQPPPPGGQPDPVVDDPALTPPLVLRRMSPFPVVRIAGTVLPRGARVRILSVRGPRGARVRVRCSGEGCPVRRVARTTTTRLVRLRRFERRLRAGIRLELFVRKPDRIGKYTRFTIRAGRAPARIDRCLIPGRARPVRCP